MDYKISPLYGGKSPLYNFLAPPEYLKDNLWKNEKEHVDILVFYFQYLYPLSNPQKWKSMTLEQLQDYYYHLDFWYTFNTSWTVSPKPVVLDDRVLAKWEKNTFYQAGTIVQSSITSCSWDFDSQGQKYYYAARLNNGSQIDPKYKYITKNGVSKTIRTVCREQEFWETVIGEKVEITSWGWNPYPFGIYAQGPFRGTGNFLEIPQKTIVGTCHWDIIYQCKGENISETRLWTEIFNHELSRINRGFIYMKGINVTPWIIKKNDDKYYWDFLAPNGGTTPLLVSYFCFIVGGFGGIGDPWNSPIYKSWSLPSGSKKPGYYYAPIFETSVNNLGEEILTMPEDQSIKNTSKIGMQRSSEDFWRVFQTFFDKIRAWDTNWAIEMWRFPIFDNDNTGPCVANPSDDLMMFMATGNPDVVRYSPWGSRPIDPKLSRFYKNPVQWSHIMLGDGSCVKKNSNKKGFPIGEIINSQETSGFVFVIRTQMPNVNGDINTEFADFRVTIPGQLSDGSGDQEFWCRLMKTYAKQYMYSVDPWDSKQFHNFDGEYEPWLPETELKKVQVSDRNWNPQENPVLGKTFYNFDIYSGIWTGNLSYTGFINQEYSSLSTFKGNISNGSISVVNPLANNNGLPVSIYQNCPIPFRQEWNIYPSSDQSSTSILALGGDVECQQNSVGECIPNTKCQDMTVAKPHQSYFPFATDSFRTGVVGFQANGKVANLGSSQTRWWLGSKKIPWNFHAPFVNRSIMKNGRRIQARSSSKKTNNYSKIAIISVIILAVFVLLTIFFPSTFGLVVIISLFILTIVFCILGFRSNSNLEKQKLELYFSLTYPLVPIQRWQTMRLRKLRKFYLSLHVWFKNTGISPLDYIDTREWQNQPPLGEGTVWKNFTTRTHCVKGTPQAFNPYDGKKCIGNDSKTENDTPSGILFRGRQLLCIEAGIQQTSFFQTSDNCYIDTFNAFPSVVDTDIHAWEKAEYLEVMTTWCPFPDGAYFDWSQGSGVFVKLGKHIVGYTGLDVIRRVGEEWMKNSQQNLDQLRKIYTQEWNRTGLDSMTFDDYGKLANLDDSTCNVCGLYGSLILNKAQYQQIETIKKPNQIWTALPMDTYCADGHLFSVLASYMDFKYYNAETKQWQKEMPKNQGHVANYPFPLIFGSGEFNKNRLLNEFALQLPWKYQMFNILFMMRRYCLDALFLNVGAISEQDLKSNNYEYVDLLLAQKQKPLKKVLSWEKAIDLIIDMISKPLAHPLLSIYNRIMNQSFDGPLLILTNPNEFEKGKPTVDRIVLGALDKDVYVQDVKTNQGVAYYPQNDLPQFLSANLELDHWMSELCRYLGYDSACRIKHWCGNKGLTYDVEIAHFKFIIDGSLVDDTLKTNIYEIWKRQFKEWIFLRDPLDPKSNLYPEVYKKIHNTETLSTSLSPEWKRPPWIDFDPSQSLYGWPCERVTNWQLTNRLSYIPPTCVDIALSSSYPEGNTYIWHFFWNQFKNI